MTPNANGQSTKQVQKTVFDLQAFDDVKLVKDVAMPAKPATIEEAAATVNNDTQALLDVIYDGLVERAVEHARNDMSGFHVVDEDGKPGKVYVGKFADEETGKKINGAILALAKIQGYEKSLDPDKKRALKENATKFLRDNPAMLSSIQGANAEAENAEAENAEAEK